MAERSAANGSGVSWVRSGDQNLATIRVLPLPAGPADAANPTLTEALALLRTRWAAETEGVLKGNYSFWLGSGISRERYPDLNELIGRLLDKLQAGVDALIPNCPYRLALEAVLQLTAYKGVDVTRPPSEWPNLAEIIAQLHDKYSKAFDVELRVAGVAKELFWDVLKLQDVYGDRSVPPDAEHKLLALLIAEDIVSEMVTTNWDPLIEVASEACRLGAQVRIVARNEDLALSRGTWARLLKVHGCASKARDDPGTYKEFLVVTETHIRAWTDSTLKQPFRELVHTILRDRFAFFIGLSGQDGNLVAACIAASVGKDGFPADQSRVLFTETRITAPQRGILQAIYSDYADRADAVDERAALPLYAKPLLGSVYLLALERKISILLQAAPVGFTPVHQSVVTRAVERVEALLCGRFDTVADPGARWRQLADEVPSALSRFLSIYRRQETQTAPEAYVPISNQNPSKMATNPMLSEHGLPRLLLAVALFVEGQSRALWTVKTCTSGGENGQLEVEMGGRSVRVFFINHNRGLAGLMKRGFIDGDTRQAVVVYPSEKEPLTPRQGSPERPMPGGLVGNQLDIWLDDIVDEGQTLDELMKELQRKLAA